MNCIQTVNQLRAKITSWRKEGNKIVLVPTMGNLHSGHLSLVDLAKAINGKVIVSIFVNPTQFVAGEDFDTYPRTLDEDLLHLKEHEIDLVFNPDYKEIYPDELDEHTRVTVPGLDGVFCGQFRPGHFTGVATVVIKFLNIVQPDYAVFGEKDYQQLLVIKKLVRDLALPVDIMSGPTVREKDGLAMSSRNRYLTPDQRKIAPSMYNTLKKIAGLIEQGDHNFKKLEDIGKQDLIQAGFRCEYFNIQDGDNLGPPVNENIVVICAAWLGQARLIDNLIIKH